MNLGTFGNEGEGNVHPVHRSEHRRLACEDDVNDLFGET